MDTSMSKEVTAAQLLREELERGREDSDTPALNDARLLALANGGDMPRSTRELLATVLRDHWQSQEDKQTN